VSKEVSQTFFAITLRTVHNFPPNLAHSGKNAEQYPLKTVDFTWSVYMHYLVMLQEV